MRAKRANPEARLQVSVKQYLNICLPSDVWWTANLAGVRLSPREAAKAKAMGLKAGWPDLQFLLPDGRVVFVELKAGSGLSPEQRAFRDAAQPHGMWALCRSVDEVARVLRGWGVALRDHPFGEGNDRDLLEGVG